MKYAASRFIRVVSLLALSIAACGAALADDAPSWLKQAAGATVPTYDRKVNAVVLFKENAAIVDESGRIVTSERFALKILSHDGRKEAVAIESYLSNFSQVKDMQAWLISPGGTVTAYGKKDIIDQIAKTDDVYDEERIKVIDARGGADTGYIFGFSLTKEDQALFYQDTWLFQDNLPTLDSRYSLTIPNGWNAAGLTFNHADVQPVVNGNSYSWELRDLSPIPDEPMSPSFANLAPRLAVTFSPSNADQAPNRSFADWTAVSRWIGVLQDPQVVIDDNVAAKSREVTAGAKSEIEMIRAIGSFVQKMQYIAIDIGVGYGNGMKPRPANEVLSRGYADCKNKVNLMRAMLKAVKIESYPIAIYSGDAAYVRREFPSPSQFNHCIIAIKVSDVTVGPTIITHPKLGRLMIFDATDEYTPVGDLPEQLQGSYGVVSAGDNGGLIEMPVTPAEFNAWDRETLISMSGDGSIQGTIRDRAVGQEARDVRAIFRSQQASDFNKMIEGWLSKGATAAKLIKFTREDKQADSAFNMDVEFAAPTYGQLQMGRLLVFKPAVTSRTDAVYLTDKKRTHPVVVESTNSFKEKVTINLPQGFAVDEMPDPVNIQGPFGRYSTSYEEKDGKLYFVRSLTMTRGTFGVDRYDEIRNFFSKVRDAEQAPVVLARK